MWGHTHRKNCLLIDKNHLYVLTVVKIVLSVSTVPLKKEEVEKGGVPEEGRSRKTFSTVLILLVTFCLDSKVGTGLMGRRWVLFLFPTPLSLLGSPLSHPSRGGTTLEGHTGRGETSGQRTTLFYSPLRRIEGCGSSRITSSGCKIDHVWVPGPVLRRRTRRRGRS